MTDYADILKKIRHQLDSEDCDMVEVFGMMEKAADAIEALVKERGEAAMRYNDAVDDLKAAEAQAAKLKEALNTICETEDALIKANPLVNSQWQQGMNDAWLSAASIARRALEGK